MIFILNNIVGLKTRKNLIATAFSAVGRVMYVYGGGWNEEDNGGGYANSLGLKQEWLDFTKAQDSRYNHKDYDYKINLGLDCSAYVAWVIHNTLGDNIDYVTKSTNFGYALERLCYGYITDEKPHPGDIMFTEGHIYISLGLCEDNSMLLLHSSPNGVQLSGTYDPYGNQNSKAVKLSKGYMQKYFAHWYNLFPNNSRDESYLKYKCFHWTVLGNDISQKPCEVLRTIFE